MSRALLAAAVVVAAGVRVDPPKGWSHAGSNPRAYEIVQDRGVRFGDAASVRLRSTAAVDGRSFGTMTQIIRAEQYRGHRVRFDGQVRTRSVFPVAALWLRADADCGRVVAFENTETRGSRGTEDWKAHSIVLDIPRQATILSFGALLSGAGDAWFSALRLEIVGDTVPVTAPNRPTDCRPGQRLPANLPTSPVNLDFREW